MARILQPHECLIYNGEAALRAPDGTPLVGVPQYIIATVGEADPALLVPVATDEIVVIAGVRTYTGQKQAALERYEEALRAGKRPQLPEDSAETLYIKVADSEIRHKTRLTENEETACREIVATMVAQFGKTAKRL